MSTAATLRGLLWLSVVSVFCISAGCSSPSQAQSSSSSGSLVQAQQSGAWNVAVTNLPLDSAGNVRTSAVASSSQFTYETVLAYVCPPINLQPPPPNGVDLCVTGKYGSGGTFVLVRDVLTNLAGQGFELFSVTPVSLTGGFPEVQLVYTLRKPAS